MSTHHRFRNTLAYGLVAGSLTSALLACSIVPGWVPGATPPTATVAAIGNATGSARAIANGESATGRLGAQSTDSFTVKVGGGEALRLDIDVDGKPEDLTIGVADGTGKAVVTHSAQAGKRVTVVTDPLPAGDYVITLTNVGSDETPYTLTVATGDPAIVGVLPSDATPLAQATTDAQSGGGTATPLPEGGTVPGGTGVGGTGQTACDHPFMPMRAGATWTYDFVSAETSGTYVMTIDTVSGDAENATAQMTMAFEGFSVTYNWTCTRTGGLQSLDYALGSLSVEGVSGSSNITGEGVFLLPADQLVTNASWTYGSSGEMTMSAGGVTMSGTTTSSATCTVAGVGTAIDFGGTTLTDTLTVLTEQTIKTVFAGIDTPAADLTTTSDYVRGVGMISSATASSTGGSSSKLVSYSIP